MAGGVYVRELKYSWRTDGLQQPECSLLSCSCGGAVLCCCWAQCRAAVESTLPSPCQHLLWPYKLQEGRAFLIVAVRHPELGLCDLELHGCFSRDGDEGTLQSEESMLLWFLMLALEGDLHQPTQAAQHPIHIPFLPFFFFYFL